MKENLTKYFPYILGFLGIVAIYLYTILVLNINTNTKKVVDKKESPFAKISLSAKTVFIFDMATGKVIYEKNPDEPRPLASLTKVMTALTALEEKPTIKEVIINEESLKSEGDSSLKLNSRWNLKTLIDYSIMVSSNDGASAIALAGAGGTSNKSSFVAMMNAESKKIGLKNTKFFNEHGLDLNENNVGAYGSARDMATLFEYFIKKYPDALEATKYPDLILSDENGNAYNSINTNIITDKIPNLIASKTGFTDLAQGNLVIVFDAGLLHPVIISVLGSSQNGRFEDVLKLIDGTYKYINNDY